MTTRHRQIAGRTPGWALLMLLLAATAAPARGQEGAPVVALGSPELTAGIPGGTGPLALAEIDAWLGDPRNHEPLTLTLPLGLAAGASQVVGLERNPMTRAKIELGRQLYFDTRLSADGSISCASCHDPSRGYAAATRFGVGVGGQEGGRNSPVSYNRILSGAQFWDGRAASLEEQAKGPIANPIEMANTHEQAVATVRGIPGYARQFAVVFPSDRVTIDTIAAAIATFERAIVTGPSPYDYAENLARFKDLSAEDLAALKEDEPGTYAAYLGAKADAERAPMSAEATRGQELFFSKRVNCAACHVGANLADEKYYNLGVGADAANPDVGRFAVTKDPKDWGAFKTPTIRNVATSGPYMHDGSQKTLMDVVEHYDRGGTPNRNLDERIVKLNLTPREKADLVAFMEACTGSFPKVERGRLPQ
jgi:cytochrome c peroxidase